MKKIIGLVLLAGLALSSGPLAAGEGSAEPTEPAVSNSGLPAFSLETSPEDSPGLAKKKAALRLFKAYGVTLGQLAACRAQVTEGEKTAQGFSSRNGNTLATVMAVIKQQGGLTQANKNIVDTAIAGEVAKPVDCRVLIKAVADGERDLYKAPQYLDDYKLLRSK